MYGHITLTFFSTSWARIYLCVSLPGASLLCAKSSMPSKGKARRLVCALALTTFVAVIVCTIMTPVSRYLSYAQARPAMDKVHARAGATGRQDGVALCHASASCRYRINSYACPCAAPSRRATSNFTAPRTPTAMDAPAAGTVSSKLINDLANVFLPFVNDQMSNMTVPPQRLEYGVISEMHLKDFLMERVYLALAPSAEDDVAVTVSNISVVISQTPFTVKVSGVTCKGMMWSSMNQTTVQFMMRFRTLANGTLHADVSHTTATWGSMQFNHSIDSSFCRMAQSVVEVFVGKIDTIAVKTIKAKIVELLPQIISDNVSTQLARVPFGFVANPVFIPERVTATVSLSSSGGAGVVDDAVQARSGQHDPAAIAHATHPSTRHSVKREIHGLRWPVRQDTLVPPRRDLGLSLPVTSVNDFLSYEQMMGNLYLEFDLPRAYSSSIFRNVFPKAYEICPDCPLRMLFLPQYTPSVMYEEATRSVVLNVTHLFIGIAMIPRNQTATAAAQRERPTRGRDEPMSGDHGRGYGRDGAHADAEGAPRFSDCALREDRMCAVLSRWRRAALDKSGRPGVHSTKPMEMGYTDHANDLTLLMLSVNATAMVSNLSITGDEANIVNFAIQRVTNFAIGVVESNVGPLVDSELTSNGELMINYVAIPLLNLFSPFALPYVFSDAVINITDALMNTGVNVDLPFRNKADLPHHHHQHHNNTPIS